MIVYKALIEALTKDHLIISGLDVTDVINIYNNSNFIAVLREGKKGDIYFRTENCPVIKSIRYR